MKNDDTVSRQAAINTVTKHYRAHDNDLLEVIAYEIEQLPSAEKRTNKRTKTHECDLPSAEPDITHLQKEQEYMRGWEDGRKNLMEQLSSAEPIIRCKDCREFRRYIDTDITFCDLTEAEVKEYDFCSCAVKMMEVEHESI